jgi:hypothetical protein
VLLVELQLQLQDSQVVHLQELGKLVELQLVRGYPIFMNYVLNLNKKKSNQARQYHVRLKRVIQNMQVSSRNNRNSKPVTEI